ncbi:class I adenylate-forming enzyme family protein [Salinactinospora qingdaonensis]|uniref:AMP-binding protein n=1 Tax=Salinactinospora qingdaonensis TaxID=702744 RepID=A0ABP7GB69_9ACTN
MKTLDNPGRLFDVLAQRNSPTTLCLSRPLDIAPDSGTAYSVRQLAELTEQAAGWLAAAGAGPGERVAVVKPNHWDFVLLTLAAARLGAVAAPISAHLAPDTVATMLKRLEPAVLVTTADVVRSGAEAGVDLTSFARRTVSIDRPTPGAVPLADLRGHPAPPPAKRDDDQPLVIIHTSGTTGVPKLVPHSTTTIIRRLAGFEAHRWPVLASRPEDSVASAISFAHGRALAWTASVFWLAPREVTAVCDPTPERAEAFLRAHPPTILETLPSTYVRWQSLASTPDSVFSRVRLYISTFDAMHPPTVRAFLAATRRKRPVWLQGWGQSETGPLTFRFLTRAAMARQGQRHPTTRDVGWPVPTRTRLRAIDPVTFRPVPRGTPGLIMARTKGLGLGYVGEEERWWAKSRGTSWWNTGDIGVITRSGGLRLVDREVDTIPESSCLEMEDVIDDRLPWVLECIVLGAPGRSPLPVIVTANGTADMDAAAWRSAVADLPPLAEPIVMAWEELPRTATGKVRRHQLRELLLDGAGHHGTGQWT